MAGQDYPKRLDAGATQNVNIAGDYIFCKFADRPFTVIMDGSRVTMEAGDKYRNSGGFTEFEIENTDLLNPIAIVLTIGQGDYSRQIVRGEIQIEPGLRKADGKFVSDTRTTIEINLAPSNLALTTYAKNDVIARAVNPTVDGDVIFRTSLVTRGPNDLMTVLDSNNAGQSRVTFISFDSDMVEVSRTQQVYGYFAFPYSDFTYRPGHGYFLIDQGRIRDMNQDDFPTVKSGLSANAVGLCWIPERQVWAVAHLASAGIDIYDPEWNLLFNVPSDTTETLNYDAANDWLIRGRQGVAASVVDFNGVQQATYGVPSTSGTLTTDNGLFTINGMDYYTNAYRQGGASVPILVKAAVKDYTTKPEFIARRPGCELAGAFIRPDAVPQITATVSVEELPRGVSLSGQIIKAALEYYYRRAVPADYLDHIYYFNLSADGNGLPFKAVNAGNQTFDRANVVDAFSVLTPARVTLTIDNGLTLGGPL
jgi:hypothetical protein